MITSAGNSSSSCRYSFFFEVDPLGPVFLHEVRLPDGGRQIAREGQARLRGVRRKTQTLERWPSAFHEALQRFLGIRCDIRRDEVQPSRQKQCSPACADDARSDDGDAVNRLVVGQCRFLVSELCVGDASEVPLRVQEVAFS
jgi:hypothetical protein